jgi:hypothetical protein
MLHNSNKSVIAHNIPLRLTFEQMENPMDVLAAFFGDLSLDETREILWEAFSKALQVEKEAPDDLSCKDLLYLHGLFEALIEASFLLYESNK